MNARVKLKFAKGVRFRHERDGSAMLLVPEGVLELNRSAAAALDLVDGRRTFDEILAAVVERFDVSRRQARGDLTELFGRLAQKGFLTFQ